MLKIWGRLSSINVQKVVWCASELGCRFERIDAGGAFGVVDTPGFERLNPNRKVPVLEVDGIVLWESNAIVRYLCARYAEAGLSPEDLAARAECDKWMDWQATELTPPMREAFMQLVRTPPQQRDAALVEASIRQTEPMMDILERSLADRAFVAGDRFTMADIPVGCAVHRWLGLPHPRIERPHLEKWYLAVSRRAPARDVLVLPLA